MPFDPVQVYGALPAYDRREFAESGFLTETVKFTPEQEVKQKKAHAVAALGQVAQVQIWRGSLAIEIAGALVADANGLVHGLPAGYVGQAVTTCAHFAAGTAEVPAIARHGYTRDPEKLLLIETASTDLGEEEPAATLGLRYFPFVDATPLLPA
ncbi:MAG TPA: hypothetical protein DIT13_04755 [Verrucomicrobiales bacterium]|nr:hypothetical protein [Verrucomicrobiales bacterium]HRJ09368.1 hypothetical protein [Prosthecobacter sp.]HRK15048.1 hypothetical protein [Prosthecobacter sp.]